LSFVVKITYKKQPKNFSVEANRDQELKMSKSIQSMYTPLLRKQILTVSFQDVERQTFYLKKAGIADKLDEMTKDEVAKALGVDAVISGTLNQNNQNLRVLQLLQLFY
jgi:hypothetical protein